MHLCTPLRSRSRRIPANRRLPHGPFWSTPAPEGNYPADLHHQRLVLPPFVFSIHETIKLHSVLGVWLLFAQHSISELHLIMCTSRYTLLCVPVGFVKIAEWGSIAWLCYILSFIQLTDICVDSSLKLLWIGVLCPFRHMPSYALAFGVGAGVKLLGHRACICLTVVGTARLLQKPQKWFY